MLSIILLSNRDMLQKLSLPKVLVYLLCQMLQKNAVHTLGYCKPQRSEFLIYYPHSKTENIDRNQITPGSQAARKGKLI